MFGVQCSYSMPKMCGGIAFSFVSSVSIMGSIGFSPVTIEPAMKGFTACST